MSNCETCMIGILFTTHAHPNFDSFWFVSSNEVLVVQKRIERLVVSNFCPKHSEFCFVVCLDNLSIYCYVDLEILWPIDRWLLQFPLVPNTIINFSPTFGYWITCTLMPPLEK